MTNDWTSAIDNQGETPISRGLKSGHAATVTLILQIVEPPDPALDTPFHRAARNSRVDDVRQHLEQGADIDATDQHGLTALHWAAINGCMDLAKLLVNRGAAINARDEHTTNMTPLSLAKWMGYEELADFLMDHDGLP